MDALRAYDSDFSESNEPGDEQAGGAAAEDAALLPSTQQSASGRWFLH